MDLDKNRCKNNVIEISLFVMLQQMIGFCKAFQFIENMLDDEAPPLPNYMHVHGTLCRISLSI